MLLHTRMLNIIGLMLGAGLVLTSPATAEMSKWNLDKDHTTLGFEVAHMVVSKTKGKFTEYTGVVEMDPDKQEFKTISAVIQTASVTTDHKKRDEAYERQQPAASGQQRRAAKALDDQRLAEPEQDATKEAPQQTRTQRNERSAGRVFRVWRSLWRSLWCGLWHILCPILLLE